MKDWTDILLYFVPAVLVMMAFMMVIRRLPETQQAIFKKFLERDVQLKNIEERMQKQQQSLPLKLQAYERLVVFLERISPNNILVRVHRGGMTAQQLQSDLVATIRAEYEHNMSQQVYITNNAWNAVTEVKENMIRIVNQAFDKVGPNASGIQMSSAIFELILKIDAIPTQHAIDVLKNEAKGLLG